MSQSTSGIEKACELSGGVGKLAERLGVSQQAVHKWRWANRVPPLRCLQVHELTGVPLHELNAVIYPKE